MSTLTSTLTHKYLLLLGFMLLWFCGSATSAAAQAIDLTVNNQDTYVASPGESVTLRWYIPSSITSGCQITDDSGAYSYTLASGDYQTGQTTAIAPSSGGQATFILECTGPGDVADIYIEPQVNVMLNPTSANVNPGNPVPVDVRWESEYTTGCVTLDYAGDSVALGGGAGSVDSQFNDQVVYDDATFTVTCRNEALNPTIYGSGSANFDANFSPANGTIDTLVADPNPALQNTAAGYAFSEVTYRVNNVAECRRRAEDASGDPIAVSGWNSSPGGTWSLPPSNGRDTRTVYVQGNTNIILDCRFDDGGSTQTISATELLEVQVSGTSNTNPTVDITGPSGFTFTGTDHYKHFDMHFSSIGVTRCEFTRWRYDIPTNTKTDNDRRFRWNQLNPYNVNFTMRDYSGADDYLYEADCMNLNTGETAYDSHILDNTREDISGYPITMNISAVPLPPEPGLPPRIELSWEALNAKEISRHNATLLSTGYTYELPIHKYDKVGSIEVPLYGDTRFDFRSWRQIDGAQANDSLTVFVRDGNVIISDSVTVDSSGSDPGGAYCFDSNYQGTASGAWVLIADLPAGTTRDAAGNCVYPSNDNVQETMTCPWTEDTTNGVYVADFAGNNPYPNNVLSSSGNARLDMTLTTSVPAGTYVVSVATYDAGSDRATSEPGEVEQLFVEVSDGTSAFSFGPTPDLSDGNEALYIGVASSSFTANAPFTETAAELVDTGGSDMQIICAKFTDVTSSSFGAPSCPFTPSPSRAVLDWSEYISAGWHAAMPATPIGSETAINPISSALVPGEYDITIASYDSGQTRITSDQPNEQSNLILYDGSGSEVLTLQPPTDDVVPENAYVSDVVLTDYTGVSLPTMATQGRARHIDWDNLTEDPGETAGSHMPICAAFDLVSADDQLPTVSISASPTELTAPGESTDVTWDSSNADSCTLTSTESVLTSSDLSGGPQTVTLNTPDIVYNFTLTCTNSYGSRSDSVGVGVGTPSEIFPNLTVDDFDDTILSTDTVRGTSNVELTAEVLNDGNADVTTSFENRFTIDIDDRWDAAGFAGTPLPDIENFESVGSLTMGSDIDVDTTINSLLYGVHTIRFLADSNIPDDVNPEISELDNDLATPYELVILPPTPPMTLTVDRNLVRTGDTVDVEYSVQAGFPMNCTVSGQLAGGTETFSTSYVAFGDPVATQNATLPSSPLDNSVTFELSCTEQLTGVTYAPVTANVEVIPEFQES